MLSSDLAASLTPAAIQDKEPMNFSSADKRRINEQANLYSLLVTIDALERLFTQGIVEKEEAEAQFVDLFDQLKTQLNATKLDVYGFIAEHNLDVPFARPRLDKMFQNPADGHNDVLLALEAGQHFVTLVDALKLGMFHADELLPVARDLADALKGISALPVSSSAVTTVHRWLDRLDVMKASDCITDEEARQFSLDLQSACAVFQSSVRAASSTLRK
jgi:ESCRT-I complex subunit VPS28